jgi:hypothetical protein
MRRGFALHLIAAGCAAAALALPGVAGAKLIGPKDLDVLDTGYGCFGNPSCTQVNLNLPGAAVVRSPISGRIIRWRVAIQEGSGGPLKLQVLRRTVNKPGVAADKFKPIRETAEATTYSGINTLQASLRIKRGDFIGLAVLSNQTAINAVEGDTFGTANFGLFNASLVPGDPAVVPDQFPSEPAYLLYNARVRG